MMRFLLLIVTALAICLAVGCSNELVTYSDPEKPINTRVGAEFIIAIKLDPPGYYWKEHHDKGRLYLIEETYDPVETGSNTVSAAGTQYFRYRALKSGITYITLTRLRLSKPDIAVEKVFKVNIKFAESPEPMITPRELTNTEKIRVIEIALNTPEVAKWIDRKREYDVGPVQWYAIWTHECVVFDHHSVETDPNYLLVPESAVWYPGVTITFGKSTITHLTEWQVAVDLETEESVWLSGPIEVNG